MATAAGRFYRAPGWSIGERLAELLAARQGETLPEPVVQLFTRRYARVLAGVTGVVMGVTMFLSSALEVLRDAEVPMQLLITAWLFMLITYVEARVLGPLVLRRRVREALAVEGSAERRLAVLEELGTSAHIARHQARRLEAWSFGLPLMALALLVPLSLHLPVALLLHEVGRSLDYSGWITLSGAVVGHAHVYLAVAAACFARKLARSHPDALRREGWKIYGLTVGVSAVPGVLLLALPPIITAITGLIFVPAMFAWARDAATRERALLNSQ